MNSFDTLPDELILHIARDLHPWQYVLMCIAINRFPNQSFLRSHFRIVDRIPAGEIVSFRYPNAVELQRKTADFWLPVYRETVDYVEWFSSKRVENGREKRVRRCGRLDPEYLSFIHECVKERDYSSLLDAIGIERKDVITL